MNTAKPNTSPTHHGISGIYTIVSIPDPNGRTFYGSCRARCYDPRTGRVERGSDVTLLIAPGSSYAADLVKKLRKGQQVYVAGTIGKLAHRDELALICPFMRKFGGDK